MSFLATQGLQQLVHGLRAHESDRNAYISEVLPQIKKEVDSTDFKVKTLALRKLTHLAMLGTDISWASFPIIEVMGSARYDWRRIGYLAAVQSFTENTELIIMTEQLFKKNLKMNLSTSASTTQGLKYEVGAVLNCLAGIVTKDLAKSLMNDIFGLLNSAKPYIRKRAVLCLLPIFERYPKGMKKCFERLVKKLEDDDPSVATAAINVLCELAKQKKLPSAHLKKLIPTLYQMLVQSGNNWMLIKLVKLLGYLVPLEPRLEKKLIEPLSNIISITTAKSLKYECINTASKGKLSNKSLLKLCLEHLTEFIEHNDQNLKYLGLLGLNKIIDKHPRAVTQHHALIMKCLDDEDVTIRKRALDLITKLVTRKNLEDITEKLLQRRELADGEYSDLLLSRVLDISYSNDYALISDFGWYIETLCHIITTVKFIDEANSMKLNTQLMDVIIRVVAVRQYGISELSDVLLGNTFFNETGTALSGNNPMKYLLHSLSYLVGEFSDFVHPKKIPQLIRVFSDANVMPSLSGEIQAAFVNSIMKLFSRLMNYHLLDLKDPNFEKKFLEDEEEEPVEKNEQPKEEQEVGDKKEEPKEEEKFDPKTFTEEVLKSLKEFTFSNHIEVQERSVSFSHFLAWFLTLFEKEPVEDSEGIIKNELHVACVGMASLYYGDLLPVHPGLIHRVKLPKGLDLDAQINEPPEDYLSDEEESDLEDPTIPEDESEVASIEIKELELPEGVKIEEKSSAKKKRKRKIKITGAVTQVYRGSFDETGIVSKPVSHGDAAGDENEVKEKAAEKKKSKKKLDGTFGMVDEEYKSMDIDKLHEFMEENSESLESGKKVIKAALSKAGLKKIKKSFKCVVVEVQPQAASYFAQYTENDVTNELVILVKEKGEDSIGIFVKSQNTEVVSWSLKKLKKILTSN